MFLEVFHYSGDNKNLEAKMLMSACTLGAVKIWDCRPDGTLRTAANFQVSAGLSSFTAIPMATVIPPLTSNAKYESFAHKVPIANDLDTVISGSVWNFDDNSSIGSGVYYEPSQELLNPLFMKPSAERTVLEVLCICGASSGKLETWKISTDQHRISVKPIFSEVFASATVSSLYTPVSDSVRIDESVEFVTVRLADESSPLFPIIAAHSNGCVLTLSITPGGSLVANTYFAYHAAIRNIICCHPQPTAADLLSVNMTANNDNDSVGSAENLSIASHSNVYFPIVLECQCVSELELSEVLIWARSIPNKWRRPMPAKSTFASIMRRTSIESKTDSVQQLFERSLSGGDIMDDSRNITSRNTQGSRPPTAPAPIEEGMLIPDDASIGALNIQMQTQEYVDSMHRKDSLSGAAVTADDAPFALAIPLKSMERAINANLHATKRDFKLLQMFKAESEQPGARSTAPLNSTISVQQAVDCAQIWLGFGEDQDAKASLWDLVRLLGINVNERLPYIKLAKIVAVAMAAFKVNPLATTNTERSSSKSTKVANGFGSSVFKGHTDCTGKEYDELKSYGTVVSYNAMGERIFERKKIVQGKVRGCMTKLRDVWDQQSCRVITQEDGGLGMARSDFPRAVMTEIPEKLKPFIARGVEVAKVWSPLSESWLDTRKAIHIAREVIAFRYSKQQEFFLSTNQYNPINENRFEMEDMAKTLILYFERQYGSAEMGMKISHQRMLYFLEACHQYMQTPVLNFIRRVICPEVQYEGVDDLSIWVYVESRHLLESWGAVTKGELVPTAASLGLVPFISSEYSSDYDSGTRASGHSLVRAPGGTTAGAKYNVNWLHITRGDALKCIDVIFRIRGRFGPLAVQRILTVLSNVPAASSNAHGDVTVSIPVLSSATENEKPTNITEIIDLEMFLEVMVVEFSQLRNYIANIDDTVFGDDFFMRNFPSNASIASSMDLQIVFQLVEEIRGLMTGLVQYDTKRTGVVNEPAFRIALLRFVPADKNIIHGKYVNALIDRCATAYRVQRGEDEGDGLTYVSYSDYWSVLMSWLTQTKITPSVGVPDLFYGSVMQHGLVEDRQVISIITLIGLMQAPQRLDPFWTCSDVQRTKLFAENEDLLRSANPMSELLPARAKLMGIDRTGQWAVHSLPMDDRPGVLTVQKIIPSVPRRDQMVDSRVQVKASLLDKHTRKFAEKEGIDVDVFPMVPYRVVDDPLAYIGDNAPLRARPKSPFSMSVVSTGRGLGSIGQDLPHEYARPSSSYSRSIENLVPEFSGTQMAMDDTLASRGGTSIPTFSNNNYAANVSNNSYVAPPTPSSVMAGSVPAVGVDLEDSMSSSSSASSTMVSQVLLTDHMHAHSQQQASQAASPKTLEAGAISGKSQSQSRSQVAINKATLSPRPTEVRFDSSVSSRPSSHKSTRHIDTNAVHTSNPQHPHRLHSHSEDYHHHRSGSPSGAQDDHESQGINRLVRQMKHEHHIATAPGAPGTYQLGGGSVWDQSLSIVIEQEMASETEVDRLRKDMVNDEALFLSRYKEEQALMKRRLYDKRKEEELRLKALREKELAAQLYADEVEKERMRKLMAQREMLEKRRLEEEAASRAHDDEINAKIAAQKARSQKLSQEKRAREDAMQEKVHELNENMKMKVEDAASRQREDYELAQKR
jgi:hypothetical protein